MHHISDDQPHMSYTVHLGATLGDLYKWHGNSPDIEWVATSGTWYKNADGSTRGNSCTIWDFNELGRMLRVLSENNHRDVKVTFGDSPF